jgi:hypothetical protein
MRTVRSRLVPTILACSVLTACANLGPPEPPSLTLPTPPTDLRATRKGNNVTLAWTIPTVTTDRQRIRILGPSQICRGLGPELTTCGTPVGKAPAETVPVGSKKKSVGKKSTGPKISESYTDVLPGTIVSDNPTAFATYAVEVLNTEDHGAGLSNRVHVPLVRTLPGPADLGARVAAPGVILTWTNAAPAEPPPALHYVYRVYRQQEGGEEPALVGEVPASAERVLTFTDSTIEWEKTYKYHADAITVITPEGKSAIEVPGDDSPEVKIFANDTFPPAVPSGLQAVSSGPGQPPFIDLIWAPDSEPDLAGYNVYRREQDGRPVKLNSELIKSPAYRDTTTVSGQTYFYSVSAVDVRANESARSEEVSETVPEN